MKRFQLFACLLLLSTLALAGCGGSSSGSTQASDPFSNSTSPEPNTTTTPVTVQDPTFSLTITTDLNKPTDLTVLPQVDVNIGTVLLTAQLLNISDGVYIDPGTNQPIAAGAPLPNQVVSFNILAGPGTIAYTTPVTGRDGNVNAIFTTGNVNYTTNVLIEATTTVDGKNYRAYTSFQIVRGTGVIMFTDKAGTKPGEQSNMLEPWSKDGVDSTIVPSVDVLQLVPFKVTDSNGNPRVGVPITLSVYSITTLRPDDVTIDFLVPSFPDTAVTEPNQQTITSDSAGMVIFNVAVNIKTPLPGSFTSSSVVFKARTNDPIPVTAYVGGSYSMTSKLPTLVISPAAASFGTATDITFTISGGVKPFGVTSNNTSRVTATLQPDGVTVVAHLVDTTAWTGSVTISATDSAGQTVSATVSR